MESITYIEGCECFFCTARRGKIEAGKTSTPTFRDKPSQDKWIAEQESFTAESVADVKRALFDKGEKAPGRENPKDLLGILKLPLRLIPPPALAYLAQVMALGAKKYGPFNWRSNAVKQTVYLEAALRHILSVLDGEDVDPESGQPHEAHAMACMAILLDAKSTGNLIDDRPTKGVFGRLVQEMQQKKEAPAPVNAAQPDRGWLSASDFKHFYPVLDPNTKIETLWDQIGMPMGHVARDLRFDGGPNFKYRLAA